ncbi:hypothetical protein PLESTB_001601800 [Pleodorina starrii]|uniref:Sucrose phosphatase-like domain-containing protein n=1 Tax=Pleodorina starrii TaxID=330485 RepID=A0A9W6F8G9_9CHLO|nr:hypothetical protein PLESTB_001601800 [Pleodorina starrii]
MDAQHAQPLPQTAASQQPCLKPADGSSNEAAAAASAAGGGPLPFWRHSYPPRLVLVSDLVQNEDTTHKHLLTFNALWHMYDTASRNLLVYSTGRSPRLYRELWEEAPLLTPHVLICSVGTEIFYLVPEPDEPRNGDGDDGGDRGGGSNAALDAAALAGGCVPRRHRYEPDAEWEALLDKGWDRQRVLQVAARFPELRRQVDSEQRRHKLSFHLEAPGKAAAVAQTADAAAAAAAAAPPSSTSRSTAATVEAPATPEDTAVGAATPTVQPREPHEVLRLLEEALREEGLKVKVVYSGGRDVDLLAEGAGKGAALRFLLGRLRRAGLEPVDGVQVNGDSGNDIELFQVPGVCGCVVANAFPELREFARKRQQQAKEEEEEQRPAGATHACKVFQASEPCAGGILQALRHFRLLPPPALHPPASRVDDDDDGRSPTSLVAAAHARLLDCGGDAAAAAASGGGGGGAGGDEAEVIQGDVAAAAAAAAAAGVWMDELELHAAKPAAGGDDAAAAYRLLPNGRRNLGKMDRMLLLVYGSSGCGGVGKGPESASSMDTLSTAAAGDAAPAAPAAGGEVQRLIARLVRGGSFGLRDVPLPPDV